MNISAARIEANIHQAEAIWGVLPETEVARLRDLTSRHGLSVTAGHLQRLSNGWYVTHAGLLDLAKRQRCAGISVHQVRKFCDATCSR